MSDARTSDTHYTRPDGVLGGPCLHCQGSQTEHVGLTCAQVRANRQKQIRRLMERAVPDETLTCSKQELISSNPLAQICSCRWHEELREPGIDCPVHPRPAPGKERFRKVASNTPWRLLPCRLCGSPAELWQRWRRDDVWDSFGACTNQEDVDGEPCHFSLPDSECFYSDRKTDAVRYWNLIMGPRGSDETAACRYEASIGSICNKCGRIHDFGTERCAECQTPRLCGAERECLRNRYVRPAWETSPAPSNRPCEHRELRRDEIDGAWFCVEPRCTFELPTVETSGDDQLVRDTIAQNTRLLSALTKVTESWVNGRRVMDGIPASVAQEVREALKLQSKETNDYTKVPEVMNPPASAAQGAEARNLTRANVMGLEEAQRATETRPVNVAPLPSIGDECPVCAYGRIGQSQGNFRCGNCGWLGPSVPSPENGEAKL